jgi:c-di-GMP-binding flagellar brake protein YcgR
MGNSIDVSESGLLMVTSETLKPGTEVVVRFALPASSQAITIETKGIVVRELPWKSIAIQFVDLKEEDRRAIAQYVKADAAQAL